MDVMSVRTHSIGVFWRFLGEGGGANELFDF